MMTHSHHTRRLLLSLLLALAGVPVQGAAADPARDPLASTLWDYYHQRLLAKGPVVFDDRVRLDAPPFAEDARQVPISIDASAFAGQVERIEVWAERNPIPQVLTYHPESAQALPRIAIRMRVEQATPIRAAVLTRDGVWHVGSAFVEAAGGGCSAPSVVRTEAGWEQRLGQVRGGRFVRGDHDRLRLLVSHPMDNGLISGIPEFYVEQAEIYDAQEQRVAWLQLYPAVSENPSLTLDVGHPSTAYRLQLRDNNGNRFEVTL